MLLRLQIHDLAIIDALTLDFSSGFTALTGETGAGKSIIMGALNLVLGERASADDVRTGADCALVEAQFEISGRGTLARLLAENNLLEVDSGETVSGPKESISKNGKRTKATTRELIIRREITARGRGRCLVNGRLVPLSQLKRIGDLLVDLHGQHQHQSLLKMELHREILDAFGGAGLAKSLETWRELYRRHGEVTARLRALNRDERQIARQKDILEFQIQEIRDAALEPGEDAALEEEKNRLAHAEALRRNTTGANELLFEGEAVETTVNDLLAQCEDLLAESARLDPSLGDLGGRIVAARAELDDIASTLRSYSAGLERDPERLAEIEERLYQVTKLKRKYGQTVEEILAAAEGFEAELHTLIHSREEQEDLEAERADLESKLCDAAETLSEKRRRAGEKLGTGLKRELKELEMPNVRFQVRLDREESEAVKTDSEEGREVDSKEEREIVSHAIPFADGKRYRVHEHGVDQVEFLLSPNRGEDLKSLRRIASGGELSRIMLALKVLMRSLDQVPTLVFDEIDTGISGQTGARIGEKMCDLGSAYQVLCITHLPQIAARATEHYAVRKIQEKGRTLTRVERLDEKERLVEIARLLGGKTDSSIARRHARELLTQSQAPLK